LRDQTGKTLQEQGRALLEALRERKLELYEHSDLLADLKTARIVEKTYGWRLDHPRGAATGAAGTPHGDTVSALSFAVAAADRYRRRRKRRYEGPLVYNYAT